MEVRNFWSRVSAVLLAVALCAGNTGLCAGWEPTPQARLTCCSDDDSCPMHPADAHGSGILQGRTQPQADTCCASSEQQPSAPSGAASVTVITHAVVDPWILVAAAVPALVLTDGWRIDAPAPRAAIPKHLLLSVFLV
jgi:hypothetical protein